MLKFSGVSAQNFLGLAPANAFLADLGTGPGVAALIIAPVLYPTPLPQNLVNLAVTLPEVLGGLVVLPSTLPPGTAITVTLLRNGGTPTGLSVTFVAGDPIIKVAVGVEPFAVGETVDLLVSTTGVVLRTHSLSAALGEA